MESIPNEIACIIFSYLPYNYFVQLNLLNKYYNMLCDITLHKTYLNFKCLDDEDIKYALNKIYPTKYNINYEDDDKYLEKLEYALLENYDDTEIINLFLYDKTFYFNSNSNYTNLCIVRLLVKYARNTLLELVTGYKTNNIYFIEKETGCIGCRRYTKNGKDFFNSTMLYPCHVKIPDFAYHYLLNHSSTESGIVLNNILSYITSADYSIHCCTKLHFTIRKVFYKYKDIFLKNKLMVGYIIDKIADGMRLESYIIGYMLREKERINLEYLFQLIDNICQNIDLEKTDMLTDNAFYCLHPEILAHFIIKYDIFDINNGIYDDITGDNISNLIPYLKSMDYDFDNFIFYLHKNKHLHSFRKRLAIYSLLPTINKNILYN